MSVFPWLGSITRQLWRLLDVWIGEESKMTSVNKRNLQLPIDPHVGQFPEQSSRVARHSKREYSR